MSLKKLITQLEKDIASYENLAEKESARGWHDSAVVMRIHARARMEVQAQAQRLLKEEQEEEA